MDPIYLEDIESCYIRTFDSHVVEKGNDGRDYIILDRTAMYPTGGGQPSDKGILKWEGGSTRILDVRKMDVIRHYTDGTPPELGTRVKIDIDWMERYDNMRMHTAQHLLSSIIWHRYNAKTVGNQIHSDRSHIDFHPLSIDQNDLEVVENEVNATIIECHPVNVISRERSFFEGLDDVQRLDLSRLPRDIVVLRSIEIGEGGVIDRCPCAGTHIKNSCEIGQIRIIGKYSKGKGRTRIEYMLESNDNEVSKGSDER